MPILLDDISSITNAKARPNTPRFFDKLLTGSGKAVGLINQNLKPGRYPLGQSRTTRSLDTVNSKFKTSSNAITVRTMPIGPLTTTSIHGIAPEGRLMLDVPVATDRFHVTQHATALDFDVYLDLTPQSLILNEDGSGEKTIRHLDVLYRMEVFVVRAPGTTGTAGSVNAAGTAGPASTATPSAQVPLHRSAPRPALAPAPGTPRSLTQFAMVQYSFAPLDDAEELIRDATQLYTSTGNSVFVDVTDLATWMADYDLYDRICRQADAWSGSSSAANGGSGRGIGDIISDYVTTLFQNHTTQPLTAAQLEGLVVQLRYLENYSVPLESYRRIYDTVRAVCPPAIADQLTKQNLNLLMNDTLAKLDALKPQLAAAPTNQVAVNSLPSKFSVQQREAITTAEPLSLTTAGAGTGKSSTILARIDYLTACGIDPKEITVLSFTNAAADNILAKNPSVGSMTIARMVLDIYKLNHSTHQISTIDTIVNSLDIFYPNDNMARAFRGLLIKTAGNKEGSTTALNAFVEQHFDAVMQVLNTINQTCLELQIIIAYQQIEVMVEPPHLAGKYLIVDEVQDNSIFEFIYLLRYVTKHHQNMFIVGDASQTLYEFRSANPKALNALEGSGVFACYKLTTNYRSNQEILDFANVHLADIEANSLSQIRLQANSLDQPSAKSFTDRVQLEYRVSHTQTGFRDDLPGYMLNIVKPYVDACLARGEKVAFLAYKKLDLAIIEKSLNEMYAAPQTVTVQASTATGLVSTAVNLSGQHVANITSNRRRPTTIFSAFVKQYWNDVKQVQPGDASVVIYRGIVDNLGTLVGRSAAAVAPVITKIVSDWWVANGPAINGWVALHDAGKLARDEFFDRLLRNVLDFEIDSNGIKQNILNQQNRMRKEEQAQANSNLIVSTIHGAKGLEFDNVVVLHEYDTTLPEDEKRLYYVAFTRAMHTELILSYGKQKGPRIVTDYELIVAALERREQLDVLRQQGLSVDTMSDDDVQAALAALIDAQRAQQEREELASQASNPGAPVTSITAQPGDPTQAGRPETHEDADAALVAS